MLKYAKEVKGDFVISPLLLYAMYGIIPYFTLRALPSLKSRNSSVWKPRTF